MSYFGGSNHEFFGVRRIVNRVHVFEASRPKLPSPRIREILGQFFFVESQALAAAAKIVNLKMAKFVEKYVVEHEATHGEHRPLTSQLCTE